jgi:arginyl-tRNA synthetase
MAMGESILSLLKHKFLDAGRSARVEIDEAILQFEHPELSELGDYSTNVALVLKGGKPLAQKIAEFISTDDYIAKIEVAGTGFINIWLRSSYFVNELNRVITQGQNYGKSLAFSNQRLLIEFAHPNTHKEMHIGHMRTLVTGEAISRIFECVGAQVFRANYQGDVGPHVAKAIWGVRWILADRGMTWDGVEQMDLVSKARLLGEGYVKGNQVYEEKKTEIDLINNELYSLSPNVMGDYERTRRWSLEYYDMFYTRFGTKFDKLFFESEVAKLGKELVEKNVGGVFERSEQAIIFPGEKFGLHNRVFVTSQGNPTYEGKEIGLGYVQREAFEFDRNIHVVANEQAGYFKVVIKALELIDPWFEGREEHLSMGMVNLVGRKISSRTGDVITVDGLLDEVKDNVRPLIHLEGKRAPEVEEIAEKATLAAVKYSILKNHPSVNTAFDIKQSVSLDGNSGPYIQYTHARIRSVLSKAHFDGLEAEVTDYVQNDTENYILRYIYRYPEVVEEAARRLSPNLLCTFLYNLAQRFNAFYNKCSILSAEKPEIVKFRLALTAAVGQVIKNGLFLLGIEAPDAM